MKKKEKTKRICPYWSQQEHVCEIQEEGLFIPMDDHLRIYCTGTEFNLCRQYLLSKKSNVLETENQKKDGQERRQSPRIETTRRLNFIRLSDSGNPVSVHPSIASTLDLSSGGMRLSTRELLMYESMIQFQFNTPLSTSLLTGLAMVKWCTPTENDLQYQAGVSFQSDNIIEAVDQYLCSQA